MSKMITIFGATGMQGTSVIQHILSDPVLSKKFQIRGVTRDNSRPAAQKLLNQGIVLVTVSLLLHLLPFPSLYRSSPTRNPNANTINPKPTPNQSTYLTYKKQANLNNPLTLPTTLLDTHTTFLTTDYWTHQNPHTEYQQAKHVIDAAIAANVNHIIFSSLDSTIQQTDGKYQNVGHREGKAKAEEYLRLRLRLSGMKWTVLLVGYYMSNFLGLVTRAFDGEEGYLLRYPFDGNKEVLPLVDAERDVGLFVGTILKDLDRFASSRLLIADRYYSAHKVMETFSQVTGKKGIFSQVTPEEFRGLAPQGCGVEYMETHLMIDENGYFVEGEERLNESKELVKEETSSLVDYFRRVSGSWD